jgi:hypothetical protein
MSEAEAMELVKLHAEAERDPKLSEYELQRLLLCYVDELGDYSDEAIKRAICDAWDLKVNKATDFFDGSVNGRNMNTNQVKKNCEERARYYRRRLPIHVA